MESDSPINDEVLEGKGRDHALIPQKRSFSARVRPMSVSDYLQ
jgi:hypothetical protein